MVRPKSGGPRMTVVGRVCGSAQLLCNWFEGVRSHLGNFPARAFVGAPAAEEAAAQDGGGRRARRVPAVSRNCEETFLRRVRSGS